MTATYRPLAGVKVGGSEGCSRRMHERAEAETQKCELQELVHPSTPPTAGQRYSAG